MIVICHIDRGAGGELTECSVRFLQMKNQGSGLGKKGLGRGKGKALVDADARGKHRMN